MGLLNIFDCIHQHTGMSRPEYQILPWGNPKLPASLKLKIEFFSYCLSLSHESAKVQKMIGFPWLCWLPWLWAWSLKRNRVFTNWSTSSQALILPSHFLLWAFPCNKNNIARGIVNLHVIKVEFFAKHLSILLFTSKSIMFQLSRWKFR